MGYLNILSDFPGNLAKNLPAMQKTRVRSLGWKDPLEKEMVTYSSILAWEIPWREELGGVQSMAKCWALLSS